MRPNRTAMLAALLAALHCAYPDAALTSALAADAPAATARDDWYGQRVDAAFVAGYAVLPKPEDVTIVDSRPAARKYDRGHIPTAINIPDTQFDKLTELLPKDKKQLLIFYCEGVDCMLSHQSAFKAEKLGYTNIKVYAEGYPDWVARGHLGAVSVPYLKKRLDEGAPITVIDSRPKERKYDKGHIPGAVSLPDAQFDKLLERLPTDKARELYFYCEGLACSLSSDSAAKAVRLGYTNVKVVPEGYPLWAKLYGPGPTGEMAAAKPTIQGGKEAGSITIASFERILRDAPDTIHLVDVRAEKHFRAATIKGAINIPIDALEDSLDELPKGKPIVFFCTSGARSGDAYDMVKEKKLPIEAYFLDANVKFDKDGNFRLEEN